MALWGIMYIFMNIYLYIYVHTHTCIWGLGLGFIAFCAKIVAQLFGFGLNRPMVFRC